MLVVRVSQGREEKFWTILNSVAWLFSQKIIFWKSPQNVGWRLSKTQALDFTV